MEKPNLGNQLNQIVHRTVMNLFQIGELSQVSYLALENFAKMIHASPHEVLEFPFPIGVNPDGSLMLQKQPRAKQELIARCAHLAENQLALNGIYQLVTTVETMLGDICRSVILKYPKKLGGKRSVAFATIIEAQSIEALHLYAADSLLHELSYKSPKDFAEAMAEITGVNLLEIPAFHRYIEVKATRDVYLHNQGIANEIYLAKASTHTRVQTGQLLPVNIQYFLQAYEAALQIAEVLELKLHEQWPSSEREERNAKKKG
jgi:hypothetical protein